MCMGANETQEKILDSATNFFAEKGYNGTTTSEIAKAAGVAEGTIFKYYPTKKQLLYAVLDRIVHVIIPAIADEPVDKILRKCMEEEPRQIVKELIIKKFHQINQNIACIKILVTEIQYHEDLKRDYLQKFLPNIFAMLEEIYQFGVKMKFFRDIDAHIAVRSFAGMLAVTIMDKNVLGRDIDIEKELDVILDIYQNGVSVKKEG